MNLSSSSIPTVVQQYVDVAAILWLRRDRAVGQPHFTLADLTKLDDQLEADIDGLRIAGDLGWQVAAEGLHWAEPGELFTAGVLAWESGDTRRVQAVIAAAAESSECARALVSSLGWLNGEMAAPHIERLLGSSAVLSQRVGIAACVAQGHVPSGALEKALAVDDSVLRARALRAIGEMGRSDLLPAARDALRSSDEQVRSACAWTLARFGEPLAAVALQEAVERRGPDQHRALAIVLRRLDPAEAIRWLARLAQNPESVRQAIVGAGVVGTCDAVPWLLEIMADPRWSRVAAEAFVMITGIDLATARFESRRPAGFTAGPTDDPADDNVELDPDENLSWPDAQRLAAWWEQHREEFVAGTRYLCGRPPDEPWLEAVLRDGSQRQRAAAALELALLRPHQPLFNVRAPGHRQQQWLESRRQVDA